MKTLELLLKSEQVWEAVLALALLLAVTYAPQVPPQIVQAVIGVFIAVKTVIVAQDIRAARNDQ